ncbi:MAG: selenocysteine-specific translation elongation factor [Phycisphaerales bacterium]
MNAPVTIGTAGHIDHGKTALVRALSGVDTDRLPEERARGITIDLGFAHVAGGADAASGTHAPMGIVDVPGHERFVRTMLAGAAGIDVALIVVAADDSVMPQTREHVAILELLGVPEAVVALTKCDRADPDWRQLVAAEVRELLEDTPFAAAEVIETSAVEGTGIDELRVALAAAAARCPRREAGDPVRLPIDRVFTRAGRGTVVTGTLWSGQIAAGDALIVAPSNAPVRVREIQSHGQSLEVAGPGRRVAVALGGIHHEEVGRGDELVAPGAVAAGPLMAAWIRVLPSAPRNLKHRARVRLHAGTREAMARVRLLETSELEPGASGLALIAADGPFPVCGDQPLVLRTESPVTTLGGGRVLLPACRPVKRRDAATLAALRTAATSDDALAKLGARLAARASGTVDAAGLWREAGIGAADADDRLAALVAGGLLIAGPDGSRRHPASLDRMAERVARAARRHHARHPLEAGIERDALAETLERWARTWGPGDLDAAIAHGLSTRRLVDAGGGRLAAADFRPAIDDRQRAILDTMVAAIAGGGLTPPSPAEAASAVPGSTPADAEAMAKVAVAAGRLVHVGAGIHLAPDVEAAMRRSIAEAVVAGASLSMSELRQRLETTRKFAVPFGAHLDRLGITRRVGDERVAGRHAAAECSDAGASPASGSTTD